MGIGAVTDCEMSLTTSQAQIQFGAGEKVVSDLELGGVFPQNYQLHIYKFQCSEGPRYIISRYITRYELKHSAIPKNFF